METAIWVSSITLNLRFQSNNRIIICFINSYILGVPIVDPIVPPYSTIGPVTGSIIVLCLVIGFAMYCYRQNLDSGVFHSVLKVTR